MEAPTNLLVRGHNVKKVVDYRLDNGKRFYKVKWESTWEPEDSLLKFQNLVDQFWGFVNRVKSEDDRYPMKKRPKLLTDHEKENSDSRYVEYTDHISSEAASIRDDGSTPTYQKQVYDETIEPKNDPNRLKALAEISQQNIPSIHNSPIGNRDGADDSKQGETEGEAIENNEKNNANVENLEWNNPYVRISFFCRICNKEQMFKGPTKWKEHFVTHLNIQEKHEIEEDSDELSQDGDTDKIGINLNDSGIPWIQKVTYLIQKWGVNRYVRIAFLCRICNKELDGQHTGNWRNHHLSHSSQHLSLQKHQTLCKICHRSFSTKQELKQHYHEAHQHKRTGHLVNSCKVCQKNFSGKYDLKQHMLLAHTTANFNLLEERRLVTSSFAPPNDNSEKKDNENKVIDLTHSDKRLQRYFDEVAANNEMLNTITQTNRKYLCGTCYQQFGSKSAVNLHQKVCGHDSSGITTFNSPSMVDVNKSSPQSSSSSGVSQSYSSSKSLIHETDSVINESLKTGEEISVSETYSVSLTFPGNTSISSEKSKIMNYNETKNKYHICGYCYKNFKTKSELNSHCIEGHADLESEARRYSCKICNRGFKRKFDMNRHTANVHSILFEDAKLLNENPAEFSKLNKGNYTSAKRSATMCDIGSSKRKPTSDEINLIYQDKRTLENTEEKVLNFSETSNEETNIVERDIRSDDQRTFIGDEILIGTDISSQGVTEDLIYVKQEEPDDYQNSIFDERPPL